MIGMTLVLIVLAVYLSKCTKQAKATEVCKL